MTHDELAELLAQVGEDPNDKARWQRALNEAVASGDMEEVSPGNYQLTAKGIARVESMRKKGGS